MREILFRGKTEEGKWVYGYLFVLGKGSKYEGTYILGDIDHRKSVFDIWECAERVIPETVGQWTGMTDKNGEKIFEGDILRTRKATVRTEKLKGYYGYDDEGYPKKIPGYEGFYEYHYPCQADCYAEVVFSLCGGYYLKGSSLAVNAICNEIAGNIHDNPELLK